MKIRNIQPADHKPIVEVMPKWWGGRDLSASLLKIFFIHCQNTCFIAEEENEITGFLVGFLSQYIQDEAYIQLAGVHPNCRKQGVGKRLYQEFYTVCKSNSVSIVKSCTSPQNTLSIAFHQRLGFAILPGDSKVNGFDVTSNYLSEGKSKVIFEIRI
jgi:ribosomal protein S18 acetylase RimI-like enzyme